MTVVHAPLYSTVEFHADSPLQQGAFGYLEGAPVPGSRQRIAQWPDTNLQDFSQLDMLVLAVAFDVTLFLTHSVPDTRALVRVGFAIPSFELDLPSELPYYAAGSPWTIQVKVSKRHQQLLQLTPSHTSYRVTVLADGLRGEEGGFSNSDIARLRLRGG